MLNLKSPTFAIGCALTFAACSSAAAATLCVNPHGSHGCYSKIQTAVNHASKNDVIEVAPGIYQESVTIGMPLSLESGGAGASIIDASGQPNGILIDGLSHPGLSGVTISGFAVINANFEGILIVSASDVVIRDNSVLDNDKTPGLNFTGATTGCPGQPAYETDETGDCGGAIHLIGAVNTVVSGNLITGNADGVLISDETRESHDNLLIRNTIVDNPLECGIVLASHPRNGEGGVHPQGFQFSPHFGVTHNTVAENVSSRNGVQIGGAGVGLFSDGNGMGKVAGNVIVGNELTDNGLGGIDLHTHVGPSFGAPADDMNGNVIVGNYIAGNLADTFDTATPGPVGININSGDGGSPVYNTVISGNVITNESVDVAVNTPNEVHVHLNDLLGGKIGVAYVCTLDGGTACTGSVNATENFWGCPAGPGGNGCSTVSGSVITYVPALPTNIAKDPRSQH